MTDNRTHVTPVSSGYGKARCVHCGRVIVEHDGGWIDPEATGDDAVWRETCDSHDTMTAEHEPEPEPTSLLSTRRRETK